MSATGTTTMSRKPLTKLNKAELTEICNGLEIDYEKGDTNVVLVGRIEESGKYKSVKETHAPSTYEDGKRFHPQLGEYIEVIVHQRDPKAGSIFASINLYTVEFQPEEKIPLPKGMIRHLRKCSSIEHYFDPNAMSENGNMGMHKTREVPKFIVEVVSDMID